MSMADRDGFIWYDGKLVPWREANTHVLTHSLHYGLAVFEGVLTNEKATDYNRLRAAQSVLDYLLKLRELRGVEERLEELERNVFHGSDKNDK